MLIGNPENRRVHLFQKALASLGLAAARIVPYYDFLQNRISLQDVVQQDDVVRIESPGKDFAIERLLLELGCTTSAQEDQYAWLPRAKVTQLSFDKGRIHPSRQWYLGYCAALRRIQTQLAASPPHRLMNAPRDIAVMFDKVASHQRMQIAGVAVPKKLSGVTSFDTLQTAMHAARCTRVFIKLAHGSSASGVVAYRSSRQGQQAITTVEVVQQDGELRLYNTRRIRTYQDEHTIRTLIDALIRQRVHIEEWIPKATQDARAFDLRVVVIRQQARHCVVRQSRSPMTNLHLLNQRGDLDAVLHKLGPARWAAAQHTCEQAAACFPDSFYAGVDLLIATDYRRHAVLEINAFGDLLPGIRHAGEETYSAEIRAFLELQPEAPHAKP